MKCNIENVDAWMIQHHARGFERCRMYVKSDLADARRDPCMRALCLRSARQWAGYAREHYAAGMAAAAALSAPASIHDSL